ncbi:2-dehydropantoate 2-reductase [Corynebacterium felinum]|uniref:2-dehydropantoate 2-reductase n=1 Tax=Corynebacterium felinum TaxID=131318 RepID=A0ABU2B9A0_9CORY|nr:2-dehydropantoate 2-reductase [Corynebacterium felinum]MDF5821273.1 2-dehydropantoate 2-reductase [Corynebacterium felinum]MDR7355207.1 2-dehydropantoate 2-reductase [Corynebacterium felinum]WJY94558.1 2-dehydropantoate 2-reductase [Corynebacterium felinum]
MKIAIIGAGAVGCWFGGWLFHEGADVTLIARGATYEHLSCNPVRLLSPEITREVAVPVAASLKEVGDVDLIIVATKSIGEVFLPDSIPEHAVVMVTQNSVEMPQLAFDRFGTHRVIPAVVRGFFTNQGPGICHHDGNIQSLTYGSVDPRTQHVVEQLHALLDRTPIDSVVCADIMKDVWMKAMFVTTFGSLGALTGKPLGEVRTTYRKSLANLMHEIYLTARAHNVDLPDDAVNQVLAFADAQDPASTSSMQRDIMAGKESELDAQVGAVVRMAQRVGLEAVGHRLALDALST